MKRLVQTDELIFLFSCSLGDVVIRSHLKELHTKVRLKTASVTGEIHYAERDHSARKWVSAAKRWKRLCCVSIHTRVCICDTEKNQRDMWVMEPVIFSSLLSQNTNIFKWMTCLNFCDFIFLQTCCLLLLPSLGPKCHTYWKKMPESI